MTLATLKRRAGKSVLNQGIAGWLLTRFHPVDRPQPRLTVLERVALAPRQTLTLIEAEGCKLLVATAPDSAPTFFALNGRDGSDSAPSSVSTLPIHAIPARTTTC